MKRRIAILFHESARGQPLNYLINLFAECWREDGHEVIEVFGASEFVPADIAIVHVDLSVVPEEYVALAKRYPIVLNGELKDIRKSTYSRLQLKAGDPYTGKVIVKSNFNYAAVPERIAGVPLDPRGFSASFFGSPLDYQIFDSPKAVPSIYFGDPNLIVEKFMPEFVDGVYVTRAMLFLGDRVTCTRVASRDPIVKSANSIEAIQVEPHPDIMHLRKAMKFDYGKFDYVIHEDQALLLDANKTVGAPTFTVTPQRLAERRYRAEGLYSYFNNDGC